MAQQKYLCISDLCKSNKNKYATTKLSWHLFTLNRVKCKVILDSKNQSLFLFTGLLCNENIYTHVYSCSVIIKSAKSRVKI